MSRSHPRPWRRGSLFGPGPRQPLDREQRARFRFLLRTHARGGRLTPKAEWVGNALLKRLGDDGQCDPSHATLAADAACSERTVGRATASMRSLGLLRWQPRLVRAQWRAEQTSNAYELVPSAALPVPRVAVPCGGHAGRATERTEIPLVHLSPKEVAEAQAALARRRTVVEERLLRNKAGGIRPATTIHPR
jgi:hypothetical protein